MKHSGLRAYFCALWASAQNVELLKLKYYVLHYYIYKKRKHHVPIDHVLSSITLPHSSSSSGSLSAHPVMLLSVQLQFCSHQWFLHSDFLHFFLFYPAWSSSYHFHVLLEVPQSLLALSLPKDDGSYLVFPIF